jgi:hypothetical protein
MLSQYIIISTPPDRDINEGYFGHYCDGCSPLSGMRYDAVGITELGGESDDLTLCEDCYVEAVS